MTSAKDQLLINKTSDANCNLGSSAVRLSGVIAAVRQTSQAAVL